MNRYIKGLLPAIFLIIFIVCYGNVNAQGDTASYSLRQIDRYAIGQYNTQSDFTYDTTPPEQMNIFSWLWYQFKKLLYQIFSPSRQLTIWKVILYLVMIFAIVMIVLNLAGINVRGFLSRDAQMVIAPRIGEENIREMNMDELISDAAAKKQWRLAVRYLYLKALRLMTDRELIRWQPGKTNMDYYYELSGEEMKRTFLMATDDFENAWYGNAEVTEDHYRESKRSLEDFYVQIQNHRA